MVRSTVRQKVGSHEAAETRSTWWHKRVSWILNLMARAENTIDAVRLWVDWWNIDSSQDSQDSVVCFNSPQMAASSHCGRCVTFFLIFLSLIITMRKVHFVCNRQWTRTTRCRFRYQFDKMNLFKRPAFGCPLVFLG